MQQLNSKNAFSLQQFAGMHYEYWFYDENVWAVSREYMTRFPNRWHYPDYKVFQNVHRIYVSRPNNIKYNYQYSSCNKGLGLSNSTVYRILRRYILYPYQVERVQALLPADYVKRLRFCRAVLRLNHGSLFQIHNWHHWEYLNPRIVRDKRFQHQFFNKHLVWNK